MDKLKAVWKELLLAAEPLEDSWLLGFVDGAECVLGCIADAEQPVMYVAGYSAGRRFTSTRFHVESG